MKQLQKSGNSINFDGDDDVRAVSLTADLYLQQG